MVEFSDYLGDPTDPAAQSFRDLYGMYTEDHGLTWSDPVNLTNDAAQDFKESMYATAFNEMQGGLIHVQYQRDEEPGHAYENTPDPAVLNEIVYMGYKLTDFQELPPAAAFSFVYSGARVFFTDESERAALWDWNFGDGTAHSTNADPDHIYTANGSFNVCLDVENPYGTDQHCETINITAAGIDAIARGVLVFPNPTSGQVFFAFQEPTFTSAELFVLNALGQQVTTQVLTGIGQSPVSIDLSGLEPGVYMVQVVHDQGQIAVPVTLN
jgi:PKD repeat protein